ncbi:UTRA domain-containing protein [Streptomyces sp. HD]|uniref:UTRA domain-containing protein n=1 Tax=Streptomyces sp. HD TaxID=3020892 RepID=UPI003FA7502B
MVSRAEAKILGVPHLSPALLFERLTSDTDGRAVEYVHSIYRGDRYRIVTRLTLGLSAGQGQPAPTGSLPGIPPGVSHRASPSCSRLRGTCTPTGDGGRRTRRRGPPGRLRPRGPR